MIGIFDIFRAGYGVRADSLAAASEEHRAPSPRPDYRTKLMGHCQSGRGKRENYQIYQ